MPPPSWRVEGYGVASQREINAFREMLASEIRRIRIEKGLSKTELSNRSGITRQAIRMIECGERVPSVVTLWQLANGLGIPVSQILLNLKS